MWVGGGLIFLVAILAVLMRWYGDHRQNYGKTDADGLLASPVKTKDDMMSTTNKNQKISGNCRGEAAEPEWCEAKPAVIPEPTFWPMILALGVTIGLWGILTSWMFVVVGLLLSLLSVYRWVMELRK